MIGIEVYGWTEEQIRDEILVRLEPGWVFEFGPSEDERFWLVKVQDTEGLELFSSEKLTAQLVLLDALGWLESRKHPVQQGSPWVRRRGDLSPQRVHEIVYSKGFDIKEPPHLDPVEIDELVKATQKPT